MRRTLALFFLGLCAGAGAAAAHPMGNFSVNRWTRITPRSGGLLIVHLIDFAEVPTQAELSAAGLKDAPKGTAAGPFRDALQARYVRGLALEMAGSPVPLTLEKSSVEFLEGTAGLPTTRLTLELTAPFAAAGEVDVVFTDGNFEGRAGWKEIVASAGPGAELISSSVPAADRTRMLTVYPSDPAEPPSEVTGARLRVRFSSRARPHR